MESAENTVKITNQITVSLVDDRIEIMAYGEGFSLSKKDAEKLCNALDNFTNEIADD